MATFIMFVARALAFNPLAANTRESPLGIKAVAHNFEAVGLEGTQKVDGRAYIPEGWREGNRACGRGILAGKRFKVFKVLDRGPRLPWSCEDGEERW